MREAQVQYIPLILTVGEKEESENTVAVRTLDGKVKFDVKVKDFLERVVENISKKETPVQL